MECLPSDIKIYPPMGRNFKGDFRMSNWQWSFLCPLTSLRSFVVLISSAGNFVSCSSKMSKLFVCATKVRLSKQQDHERYAAQRYPTHVQSVTYPANTQAKEEAVPAANQDRI
ncbi:hypothetical protein TNCV_2777931 [Trichonephila clavipes]|nr:hypothetical protein TNCV_2777931 [Trichonephila clavipes]